MTSLSLDGPVIVTGAGGCIGSWILSKLVASNIETVAVDRDTGSTRPALLMAENERKRIRWIETDIADTQAVQSAFASVQPKAVIHLAGLQVPFCKADPVLGANVNVTGTINVLESCRNLGVTRLAYASSVAAHATAIDNPWLKTLYGAYKACNEKCAEVYWEDSGVPSVGIRPNIVYGVARDQGMSSLPTVAMLAAVCGKPYVVPFTGTLGLLYTADIAEAFIRSVSTDREGAHVFDFNGSATTVESCLEIVRELIPGADVHCEGAALPFPGNLDDAPLVEFLGGLPITNLREGIRETIARFRVLHQRGAVQFEQ